MYVNVMCYLHIEKLLQYIRIVSKYVSHLVCSLQKIKIYQKHKNL